MRSKPNPDSVPAASAFGQSPASSNGYAPSVPISVYRELSAELQATKTLLDSLNSQNQQLSQQNQQLRQEVDRVVQSALNLRQVAESHQPTGWGMPLPQPHPEAVPTSHTAPRAPRPARPIGDNDTPERFTEQREPRPRTQKEVQREIGGVWLALIVLAIVITAFGAGFMVIRPLLSPNR